MSPVAAVPSPSASRRRPRNAPPLDLAALYPSLRLKVERLVAQPFDAPAAVVEDACQVAWIRLIRHAGRVHSAGVLGWLVCTARNEVRRELHRRRREESLEARIERAPAGPAERQAEQLEHRLQLMDVAVLPERQRRIVWLQATGLSYVEIGALTGDTTRTVERQLARGRERLRAAA